MYFGTRDDMRVGEIVRMKVVAIKGDTIIAAAGGELEGG